MKPRNLAIGALVIGTLLLVLSLSADIVCLGGRPGFGTSQFVLALFGIALLAAGMGWLIWGNS